jgi:four helix bundle protein
MTKDKGMTKSQAQNTCKDYDPFWDNGDTALVREEAGGKRVYDLEERTARFGEAVIDFAKTIPQNSVTNRLINQLVGAGTSVGANYIEADDAVSKKEFLKSIGICKKETREAKHFLRGARGPRVETCSSQSLAGSTRTTSHFLKNLEERKK